MLDGIGREDYKNLWRHRRKGIRIPQQAVFTLTKNRKPEAISYQGEILADLYFG